MNIHDFIMLPHRFRWGGVGGDDCLTFPASWVRELTGIDPAAEFRGAYKTKEEAHSLIALHGGPLALIERQILPMGAKRVQQPQDGDIGLVKAYAGESANDAQMTEIGALRFGPMWAAIAPGGVMVRRAEFVAAWRLLV